MLASGVVIWILAAACLFTLVAARPAGQLQQAIQNVRQNVALIGLRLPFAVLTAGFAGALLPQEFVSDWIGGSSGWTGIVIAAFMGMFVPGAPLLSFPLALALSRAGAGLPQLVAFITSWSLMEPQRIITWEWPLLGWRFVRFRVAISALLPLIAGIAAALLVELWPA